MSLKEVNLIGAEIHFRCILVSESPDTRTDGITIQRAFVEALPLIEDVNERIEVKPLDFDTEDFSDYDALLFLSANGKASESPTPWLSNFIEDYYPPGSNDEAEGWKTALERYSTDILAFQDALSTASDFPNIPEYECSEYEIMRFIVSTKDDLQSRPSEERNRRNYYLLKYPKLRQALMDYQDHRPR